MIRLVIQMFRAINYYERPAVRMVSGIRRNQLDVHKLVLQGKVKPNVRQKSRNDRITNLNDLNKTFENISLKSNTPSDANFDWNEDYDNIVEEADKWYDMYEMEKEQHHRNVKKKIIKKTYFKELNETNLLTYAAKEQIRYLHQLDPHEWTPEKLSDSFPISLKGVKKLLRNNFKLKDEERIKRHDEDVIAKWKLLKSGDTESISPATLQLWNERKLQQNYFHGNSNFPAPIKNTHEREIESNRFETGEYLDIIKPYLDTKKKYIKGKEEDTNAECPATVDSNIYNKLAKETVCKKKTFKSNLDYSSIKRQDDPQVATSISSRAFSCVEPDMTEAQFENNLSLIKYKNMQNSEVRGLMEEHACNKQNFAAMEEDKYGTSQTVDEIFNKYHDVEMNVDNHSKLKQNQIYVYSVEKSYQHPLGKDESCKIKIPHNLYKEGMSYKVGNCVYCNDGELLYKLPTE